MKDTIKRMFEIFLICHFLISMMIGICGLVTKQNHVLDYVDMFDPAIMALLCTLPTLLTIRTGKLTMAQLILRKIFQILMVEGIVLSLLYFGAYGLHNVGELIIIATAVLLVFVGVSVIDWISGYIEAEDLNRRLAQMQHGKGEIR